MSREAAQVKAVLPHRDVRGEMRTVDLFAGPGGWDLAAHRLGLDPLGVEWDDAACATRGAAGQRANPYQRRPLRGVHTVKGRRS